jgi:hypothetical protein
MILIVQSTAVCRSTWCRGTICSFDA